MQLFPNGAARAHTVRARESVLVHAVDVAFCLAFSEEYESCHQLVPLHSGGYFV